MHKRPRGLSPRSLLAYGNAPRCELSNSKIEFNVATDIFKIPNKGVYSDTLEPDIYVTYTRQDIISNNDPIIEWIINCNYLDIDQGACPLGFMCWSRAMGR